MKIKLIATVAALLFLSACHTWRVTAANYNLPTSVSKDPTKTGEACSNSTILSFLYSNQDLTVEKARREADIKEIVSIEFETKFLYPLFFKKCVIVRGN
jgi:hypothetical protein